MGNAALLLRAAGMDVLGSDSSVYPPMSTVLAAAGIDVLEGYDSERIERLAPDLVVVGNAMSRGNPEVEWLLDTRAIPFKSLPEVLREFVLARRRNVVICGTHGKTTTTALTAFLLRAAGRDPGFLIGGVPLDPPVGAHLGTPGDPFVIEGDEYDSAFFDKRSKFIHYAPHIAVLNNLEYDHADIFRDLDDVKRTFHHLTRIVPRNGVIVLNGDDENLRALPPTPWTRVVRVGLGAECDARIENFSESADGARFSLTWQREPWAEVAWALPGMFNARNAAMAATAAGLSLNPLRPHALALGALAGFQGVKRRQEILLRSPTLTVIEDFGHHPTAIAETLNSMRARFAGARLTAVFEPRSNTSSRRTMQAAFTAALAVADEVFLGELNRPARMKEEERFDPAMVVSELGARGVSAHHAPTNAGLLELLLAQTLHGADRRTAPATRAVVFFTNGSFGGIIPRFVAAVRTG
ncbi:MAG: hypothetical protein RLZZ15_2774 [Verrucomicrobiota bacterium]